MAATPRWSPATTAPSASAEEGVDLGSRVSVRHPGGVYRERRSLLDGAVVWERTTDDAPFRVVPDGCMDLIWFDGDLLVAGPDTRAQTVEGQPGGRYVGLRFAPGTGPTVLGVPASELRDQRVPLEALWPGALVRDLTEQVAEVPEKGAAMESLAVDRLHESGPPDPLLGEVVAQSAAGRPVASIADALGLSDRQLHRRCLAAFGYGPKALARILRMERALSLARDEVPLAEVAAIAGYADQPHLAREVRTLAGAPITSFVTRWSR